MGRIRNAIRALRGAALNQKQGPVVTVTTAGFAQSAMDSYEDQAKDGYRKNVIVYKSVNLIAQNAAAVPFRLFKGSLDGDQIDTHPILDLLEKPSPTRAAGEYFQAIYSYLLLSGNTFQLQVGPKGKPPTELWPMRPDRMRIKAGSGSIPARYEYVVDGIVRLTFEVDPVSGQSEIKHSKLFAPLDDHWGMSPLVAAAIRTDSHNEAAMHNLMIIRHGGSPSGAMVYNPKDGDGNSVALTPIQRQTILNDMRAKLEGAPNAGRIMLLEGEFEWVPLGMSPKDMDWAGMQNMSAKDIALAFDVPSQLVGIEGSLTFANFEQARLALWEEGIIPRMRRMLGDLNEWLVPAYDEDIVLDYDWDQIPALADRKAVVMERVTAGVGAYIITRNEAREALGLEPIEGGDVILIPATLIPLGASGEPAEEEESEEERSISTADVLKLAHLAYGGGD